MQVLKTGPGICDEAKRPLLDLLMLAMSIPDGPLILLLRLPQP